MAVADTNFNSTLAITDVMDAGKTESGGAVDQRGAPQGNVYNVIEAIETNFNEMNAKLDADTGVSGTDFAATWNLSLVGNAGNGIFATGFNQDDLVTSLAEIETKFEGVTAKLDLDGGVTGTNYASTLNFDMTTTLISTRGIRSQGDVVDYLNTVVTKFNALLTKLDAD